MEDRLQSQIEFVLRSAALKTIQRRSYLIHADRLENDAEHSWQVALMALVLAEHSDEAIDVGRVIRMLLIHDLVEIEAGDTYVYDAQAVASQPEREARAAEHIFGILPEDQAEAFLELWREFEACETAEARFAKALDRLIPLLQSSHTGGKSWQEHSVHRSQVEERNRGIASGSERLWQLARELIQSAVERGILPE